MKKTLFMLFLFILFLIDRYGNKQILARMEVKGSPTFRGMVPADDSDYENLRVIIKTLAKEGIKP